MEGLLPLLLVVALFFGNLPALKEQWRTDPPGFIKTVWMFAVYMRVPALPRCSSGSLRAADLTRTKRGARYPSPSPWWGSSSMAR